MVEIQLQSVPEGTWKLEDVLIDPQKKVFTMDMPLYDVPINLRTGYMRDIISCDIPEISTYGMDSVGLYVQVTLDKCVASCAAPDPNLKLGFLANGIGLGEVSFTTTPSGNPIQHNVWGKITKPKDVKYGLVAMVRGIPCAGTDVVKVHVKAAVRVILFPA